jgi:hypothetical protein
MWSKCVFTKSKRGALDQAWPGHRVSVLESGPVLDTSTTSEVVDLSRRVAPVRGGLGIQKRNLFLNKTYGVVDYDEYTLIVL